MLRPLVLLLGALAAPCLAWAAPSGLLLKQTDVHATVQLGLAVVDVRQTFENPYASPVDATYVFPLPVQAAVRSLRVTCGERVIEGKIADKEAARQQYEEARKEGRRAALLEQQRDNLFTQHVAGLCPGETVVVALQYVEPVHRQDGHDSLVFPTTTGARFEPADLQEPVLASADQVAHRLTWRVEILEGMAVESFWSDTHPVAVADEGAWGADVTFAEDSEVPDSDVHLAWTLAGRQPRVAAVAAPPLPDEEDSYVAVSIEPALLEDLPPPRDRELFFVMDSSCSMQGQPWATSVAAVKAALDGMRPDDTFNLVKFSGGSDSLFERPQPATAENIAAARAWMGAFMGGGTRMDAGLIHALTQPGDPDALRLVLLATDGYIGNEQQLFEVVDEHRAANTRVFGLGVGSSVNRLLLDGLADIGRGAVQYQLPDTPIDETVARFHERIARPALTDVTIDWGDLAVTDQFPSELPDLWAGQPLRVVGRTKSAGETVVTVTGRVGDEWYDLHVPLDLRDPDAHEGVRTLWARRRIADRSSSDAVILQTALRHHLVSKLTSLVAVDEDPSPCGAATGHVDVPLVAPAGLDASLSGGIGGLIGSRGSGLGGGGTAEGLGGLGTKGIGSGRSSFGSGGGTFGAKGEGGIGTVSGDPIILGSLDRTVIDEVVRRHLNQIRYCYQRELQKQPKLGGKVVVKFTVGADGTVTAAEVKSSTLANDAVESCIVGRFLRMTFPAPHGGGVLIVSYPFAFSPE